MLYRKIITVCSEIHKHTHFMKQRPSWEANQFSAIQEISCILWKQKVHFRIHNNPSPVPALSYINPVHALWPNSWKSILILYPICTCVFRMASLFQVSPPKLCTHLSSLSYVLHCSFLQTPVTPARLNPNISLSTLFLNTPSPRSSLSVSDQVSHVWDPHKTHTLTVWLKGAKQAVNKWRTSEEKLRVPFI